MIVHRPNTSDPWDPVVIVGVPRDWGHLILPELDHPVPNFNLASSSKNDVDFIEAQLAVDKNLVFFVGPISFAVVDVVIRNKSGLRISRR